jgi:hypothetical protein
MRARVFLVLLFFIQIIYQGVNAMEPGYPDLISYDFVRTDIYLQKVWVDKDLSHVLEAEFLIYSITVPDDAQYGSRALKEGHGLSVPMSHLIKRGWNHGNDVGDLVDLARNKRPLNIKETLYEWLKNNEGFDQFETSDSPYRNSLSRTFPNSDKFKIEAEVLKVIWDMPHIGMPYNLDLHIINLGD